MTIRLMKESDKVKIRKIHDEFYSEEFPFGHFDNFLSSYIVENEKGIVVAGGIKPIAESIIVTDKNFTVKERRTALYLMLQAQISAADRMKFSHLHAFIQDKSWQLCLEKIGFKPSKGNCLVMET